MQVIARRIELAFAVATALSLSSCEQTERSTAAQESADPPAVEPAASEARAESIWSRVRSAEETLNAGEYLIALREIEAAFTELEADGSQDQELLATVHHVRGLCRMELGNVTEAISDLERARQHSRSAANEEYYASSTEALAAAYDHEGRHADAERLFRELVDRARSVHGTSSVEYGRALCSLGINLDFQDRCVDAVPLLEQATVLLSRAAPDEPGLDSAWNSLGGCAHRDGRLETALGYYERALAQRIRVVGAEHPRTALVRHNLARVLMELGRRPAALAHAEAAVRIRERELPAAHPWRRETEALYVELGGTLPLAR